MLSPGLLILCATEFEVAAFLKEFPHAQKTRVKSGGCLYMTSQWHCLVTGPGVFNTALGLGGYLENHTPALILDTGIAGAFEGAGLKNGDIALAAREHYIHTGVGNEPLSRSPLPFELVPGYPETGRGIYGFDPERVGRWQARMAESLEFESAPLPRIDTGAFLTVSAITEGRESAAALYGRFRPLMESMEGAAAAHCALCFGVPMVEIRAASNRVGERDKAKWDFPLACDRVRSICRAALATGSRD
ncbi:MAG: futalosine hydrolase [Desulfobacter sp.]|nr:MAG: futalosine hydrolase [Desulfobacter sp.]